MALKLHDKRKIARRLNVGHGLSNFEFHSFLEKYMKKLLLATGIGIALAGLAGAASAACSAPAATQVSDVAALTTLLQGNTVCVPTTTVPTMTWQELHSGGNGGPLIDYKRGPGHATDPSETVGTWLVTGNSGGQRAVVTHNYGSGGSYTYTVWNNGNGTHSFCSGAPEVTARIKPGGGAC